LENSIYSDTGEWKHQQINSVSTSTNDNTSRSDTKIVFQLEALSTCWRCWQSCLWHQLGCSSLCFASSNEASTCRWHLCWLHLPCYTARPVSTHSNIQHANYKR